MAISSLIPPSIFLKFCVLIMLISPLSSATCPIRTGHGSSSSRSEGENLIRDLNLCPKHSMNTVLSDPLFLPKGKIFEKKLVFPNLAAQDLGHYAGYYSLPRSKSARMFYFFFELYGSKNQSNGPVVIWLSGGPGCSSELALFYENGPFQISQDLSLQLNGFGWDVISNILFVDQPIGTGFSYTSDPSDIPEDEDGVSNDLYDFLQAFFKEHPQFVKNDFYITGESYAGHYIPALASRVHKGNKAKEGIYINLKGFAIGNGLTNPEIQYPAYTDFALQRGLINKSTYDDINMKLLPICNQSIKDCASKGGEACIIAFSDCTNIFNYIVFLNDNINYYDIRKKCEGMLCYDFSSMETLLNKKEVKDALGVNIEFVTCSQQVYFSMMKDWMRNLEVPIPELLEEGIRMLVYVGEEDLLCNWLGNLRWVEAMMWSGQEEFEKSPEFLFMVDDKEVGTIRSYGPLTFLKLHDAGHMVAMDQPKAALHMITLWMLGVLK